MNAYFSSHLSGLFGLRAWLSCVLGEAVFVVVHACLHELCDDNLQMGIWVCIGDWYGDCASDGHRDLVSFDLI